MLRRWISVGSILLGAGIAGCTQVDPIALQAVLPTEMTQVTLAHPPFLRDAATAERYRQEGLAYRQAGSLDAAIATLKIATALDPLNPNSYVILGWTQHLAGHRGLAIQALQTALRQDPDSVPALNALGIVYLVNGDLDRAVATHQQAVDLQPDNETAHYNLSLAYQRQGNWEAAIAHGQTAADLQPTNPHKWVALALAYWSKGDTAEALQAYQQAVQRDGRYRQGAFLGHLEQAGFSPQQIEAVAALQQASLSY